MKTAERIKEEYCYVSPDIVKEFVKYDLGNGIGSPNDSETSSLTATEPDRFAKHTVTYPNGKSVEVDVGYERFLAPEIFFNISIPRFHFTAFY